MTPGEPTAGFTEAFGRWAGRVRRRLTWRTTLTGAGVGLVVGAAAAAGCWRAGLASARPWAASAGLIGAAAGVAVARRRRWADADVALYLDGRLAGDELVTTALGLSSGPADLGEAQRSVLRRARGALEAGDPRRARPPVLRVDHVLIPVASAAIVAVTLAPPPLRPAMKTPVGADKVTLANVPGLDRVAELGTLGGRDEAQKKRLERLAAEARELRQRLDQGVERREAQADIARLRDAVGAERLSLGEGERRAGLEAALGALAREPLTSEAGKALGDRDLVRFDDEMQKLANSREAADRDRAKKALAEAAEAARKAGAGDVAKELEAQRSRLGARGERADELRDLSRALGGALDEAGRRDAEDFGRAPNDANAKKLGRSLENALKRLSPEERQRLAENLKKRVAGGEMGALNERKRRELADKIGSEQGEKELEDELRKLANEDDSDDEAGRQNALDDAERGLGDGQRALGGVPAPVAGGASPGGSKPGGSPADGGPAPGAAPGTGSKSEGGGPGDHVGQSKAVEGGELRSRAKAHVSPGAPQPGVSLGRTMGRAGETANVRGSGALGTVGPTEVNGIDRSEVPEEYREQVGRYFQP